MINEQDYWDVRAKDIYFKDDELYYTITPISLYIKRRAVFLNEVLQKTVNSQRLLDFGCGDGWMLKQIEESYPNKSLTGLDISSMMIDLAKSRNLNANFLLSNNGIPSGLEFDFIFSSAVFAHLNDDEVKYLWKNVFSSLNKGGEFIIFEQVAPKRVTGKTYIRRTIEEYNSIGIGVGFKIKETSIISFKMHSFFERYIAKPIYKMLNGNTDAEKRINANNYLIFRQISKLFLILNVKYRYSVDRSDLWGNAIITFLKER